MCAPRLKSNRACFLNLTVITTRRAVMVRNAAMSHRVFVNVSKYRNYVMTHFELSKLAKKLQQLDLPVDCTQQQTLAR